MINISKDLTDAISRVHKIANEKESSNIVRGTDIVRSDREILLKANWLQEIIKGWYMLTKPGLSPGDSTTWYANFWGFVRLYLNHRFQDNYCLSAENSLELHNNTTVIPKQIIVIVSNGGSGEPQELPFDTSILAYFDKKNIPSEKSHINGINVMTLGYALCKVTPTFFKKNPQEAEIALRSIKNTSEITREIIKHNFKAAGSRLIGAYRFLKDETKAKEIENDLSSLGMELSEENPFEIQESFIYRTREMSPYANRIVAMWNNFRQVVIDCFPAAPGLPKDKKEYMESIKEIYAQDAYNSLSIEGYQVFPELIERVQNNEWDPDSNSADQSERNALAARGYFEAFQVVLESVSKVLDVENPGKAARKDLQTWYQKLFAPSMRAGIISAGDLVGYRNSQVFIRNSRHVPPGKEALVDSMNALFDCIENETNAAVRAVLGHYLFVFIHPYIDGNGRVGRFLMNVMLASGGYPWTIVHLENRDKYMTALETAGVDLNIEPFAKFLAEEMR